MILLQHYATLARYNQWMNDRLYRICAGLPEADRRRDLGAFFRSIHGTLDHLLYGDRAWLGRFQGVPFEGELGAELYRDFDELAAARRDTDAAILAWAADLDPEWLGRPFPYTSAVDGAVRVRPAWLLVAHFFNHQTHHRGQVTTLIHQLGADPGITDLPWLPGYELPG